MIDEPKPTMPLRVPAISPTINTNRMSNGSADVGAAGDQEPTPQAPAWMHPYNHGPAKAQSARSTNTPMPTRRRLTGSLCVNRRDPNHAAIGNTMMTTTHSVGNTHHVRNDHHGTVSDANVSSNTHAVSAIANAEGTIGRGRIKPYAMPSGMDGSNPLTTATAAMVGNPAMRMKRATRSTARNTRVAHTQMKSASAGRP